MEKTFVIIKPDAMERRLMGEIISIYEKKGLRISTLKITKPSLELARRHYQEHKDKPFFDELTAYLSRSELCAMIVEGKNAVAAVRKINGVTNPLEADAGTIRGRFGLSKTENSIHSSDSQEHAEEEIRLWFPEFQAD